jgi:hypothetical protein
MLYCGYNRASPKMSELGRSRIKAQPGELPLFPSKQTFLSMGIEVR